MKRSLADLGEKARSWWAIKAGSAERKSAQPGMAELPEEKSERTG
jgi:hypothetical protein